MQATYDGECTEVRKMIGGNIQSEIRFLVGNDEIAIRVPIQLRFGQLVKLTVDPQDEAVA